MADSLMKKALDAVWPRGSAWAQKIGGGMEGLLLGVSDSLELVRIKLATLAIIRDPELTEQLDELEIDFGITPDPTLTDAVRRSRLDVRINTEQTAGTRDRMERDLQAAGFDLFVHANTQGVAPLLEMPLQNSLDLLLGNGSASFARASTASYINQDSGLFENAAVDEPRFETNGLLIEGESTNLFTESNNFAHADWVQIGTGTVTSNAINGPDGTLSADLLDDTDVDSDQTYWQQTETIADDALTRTCYFIVKENTALVTAVAAFNIGGTTVSALGLITWATNSINLGTLTPLSDGFYLAAVPITNNSSGNTTLIGRIYPAGNLLGDTGSCYVWHGQLEELPFPTSPIFTATATASRAADVCTVPKTGNMPDIQDPYTIVAETISLGHLGTEAQVVWDIGDASGFESSFRWWEGAVNTLLNYYDSTPYNIVTPGPDVLHALAQTYDGVTVKGYVDSVLASNNADVSAFAGPYQDISIGADIPGTGQLFGHIKNFRIYDRALTAAQLADPGSFPYEVNPLQFASSFLMVAGGVAAFAGEPTAVAEVFLADLLVNGAFIRTVAVWRTVAGGDEAFAGEPGAIAEQTGSLDLAFEYSVPTDPDDWPLVFFVGGPAARDGFGALISIEIAQVPALRQAELEQTILRLKPLHSWAVMMVEYI